MKKIIALIILGFSVQLVSAQTEKGSWLLGGTASFNSYKQGDGKATIVDFSPNAGYFVIDNLALGLNVSFQSVKPDGEDAATLFSGGPFVRYYFVDLGEKTKLFGHANFAFGSEDDGFDKAEFTQWGIKAGPAIFLTPSVALEFAVGYSSQKYKDFDDALNNFGVSVGFQVHLGGGSKSSE